MHLAKSLSKLTEVIAFGENPEIPGLDEEQTKGLDVKSEFCFSRQSPNFDSILKAVKNSLVNVLHIQHEGLIFGWDKRILDLQNKCRGNGIKTVVTMHSTPTDPNVRSTLLELFPCDRIVVHTDPAKAYWNTNKVVKINHGCIPLDTTVNKKELRTKLKLDPEACYIATTGYIGDLKGFKEIIEVLPEVQKEVPNAKILYLGGVHPATKQFAPKYLTDLVRTMKTHNIKSEDVHITGWIPEAEMKDYLLTPDLYVLNYKSSGVYSATGTGARIVGTRIPLVCADDTGRLEELVDGVTCMKYPQGEVLKGIRFALQSKEFMSKMANNAYDYAVAHCWANVAMEHMNLYEGIM
jgi:glycosyltransferase involved in cell wall biosynthesis